MLLEGSKLQKTVQERSDKVSMLHLFQDQNYHQLCIGFRAPVQYGTVQRMEGFPVRDQADAEKKRFPQSLFDQVMGTWGERSQSTLRISQQFHPSNVFH